MGAMIERQYSNGTVGTVELVGEPDGPVTWVPELALEVPTYLTPGSKGMSAPTLQHHVPYAYRGPYKLDQAMVPMPENVRVNPSNGNVLCCIDPYYNNYKECTTAAQNRTRFCERHGGALHPFDKLLSDPKAFSDYGSRYQQFKNGQLGVIDLDDEELAYQVIKPRSMMKVDFRNQSSKDVIQLRKQTLTNEQRAAMADELMRRREADLQAALGGAIKSLIDISTSDVYEGADRVKASTFIIEKVMGKAPEKLQIEQTKPWETVFSGVAGGTREEARAARELDNFVDVEVVNDDVPNHGNDAHDGQPLRTVDDAYPAEDARETPFSGETADDTGVSTRYGADDGPTEPEPDPYAAEQKAQEARATVAERRQALKDRLQKQRNHRMWARNEGHTSLEAKPYKYALEATNDEATEFKVIWTAPE